MEPVLFAEPHALFITTLINIQTTTGIDSMQADKQPSPRPRPMPDLQTHQQQNTPRHAPASFAAGPAGVFGNVDAYAELGLQGWDHLAAQYRHSAPSHLHILPESSDPASPPVVTITKNRSKTLAVPMNSPPSARARGPACAEEKTGTPVQRMATLRSVLNRSNAVAAAEASGREGEDDSRDISDVPALDGSVGGFRALSHAESDSQNASPRSEGRLPQWHRQSGGENASAAHESGNRGDAAPANSSDDDESAFFVLLQVVQALWMCAMHVWLTTTWAPPRSPCVSVAVPAPSLQKELLLLTHV
jgi:hypothetical protein